MTRGGELDSATSVPTPPPRGTTLPPCHATWQETANLAYSFAPGHLKWEASFLGCQPIALGPLGTLDGTVGFFDFSPKLVSPERRALL
jgi:hypothetical protein